MTPRRLSQPTESLAPGLGVKPDDGAGHLAGFVLNSALVADIPDPNRQLMFSFLRRVDGAITE